MITKDLVYGEPISLKFTTIDKLDFWSVGKFIGYVTGTSQSCFYINTTKGIETACTGLRDINWYRGVHPTLIPEGFTLIENRLLEELRKVNECQNINIL